SYCCSVCRGTWSEEERSAAVGRGHWIARQQGRTIRGYQMPRLLAPALTAQKLVDEWRMAQGHSGQVQVFHNAILGLPYLPEGGRVLRSDIESAQAASPYEMLSRSETPCALGVDVGPNWLHLVVVELGTGARRVLWIGKTADWHELASVLGRFAVRAFVV